MWQKGRGGGGGGGGGLLTMYVIVIVIQAVWMQLLHTSLLLHVPSVPEVGFSSPLTSVSEGAGPVMVTITTSNQQTTGPLALSVLPGGNACELLIVKCGSRLLVICPRLLVI